MWFFEGFTSYYDDLLLLRAGLIDAPRYLRLVAKTVNTVATHAGARGAERGRRPSFDAWTKYYRSDENTPNATVSYYAKGSLVALALDLTLRKEGQATLDDVMRLLWQRSRGGPIGEGDIAGALQACRRALVRQGDRGLGAWHRRAAAGARCSKRRVSR